MLVTWADGVVDVVVVVSVVVEVSKSWSPIHFPHPITKIRSHQDAGNRISEGGRLRL